MIKGYCDVCKEEMPEIYKMWHQAGIGNHYVFGTAYIEGTPVKFSKLMLICDNCKLELDTIIYIHLKKKGVELNDK